MLTYFSSSLLWWWRSCTCVSIFYLGLGSLSLQNMMWITAEEEEHQNGQATATSSSSRTFITHIRPPSPTHNNNIISKTLLHNMELFFMTMSWESSSSWYDNFGDDDIGRVSLFVYSFLWIMATGLTCMYEDDDMTSISQFYQDHHRSEMGFVWWCDLRWW